MLKKTSKLAISIAISTLLLGASAQSLWNNFDPEDNFNASNSEDTIEVPQTNSNPDNDNPGTATDCNAVSHEHRHIHNSTDENGDKYLQVVHAFAITLPDIAKMDTENMLCTDGHLYGNDQHAEYRDCGFDKNADLNKVIYESSGPKFGKITITYQELDWVSSKPKGLVWRYGVDDPQNRTKKPWLASGGTKIEAISVKPKSSSQNSVTITTKSWTKVESFYLKNNYDYDEMDKWNHIYTDDVSGHEEDVDPDEDYIYWFGINGTVESTFPPCEVLTCASLTLQKVDRPRDISVNDLFTDVDFEVQAFGSDGSDITADSTFTYEITKYRSNPRAVAQAADGVLRSGFGGLNQGKTLTTNDPTIEFEATEPGDVLTVYVSDYNGSSYGRTCRAEIQLPYCSELEITDPSNPILTGTGDQLDIPLRVNARASTGERWPFLLNYQSSDLNASYDGTLQSDGSDNSPLTYRTSDKNFAHFISTPRGILEVSAGDNDPTLSNAGTSAQDNEGDDVAGLCSDGFTYSLVPPIEGPRCDFLQITSPAGDPISLTAMQNGQVQLDLQSRMTDGTQTLPPFTCESINNPNGIFFDRTTGRTETDGSIELSTIGNGQLFYTGEPGDTIRCYSNQYPRACFDSISSETVTPEAPVCEGLNIHEWHDGLPAPDHSNQIDISTEAGLEQLYATSTLCAPYDVNTSDASFRAILELSATAGNFTLENITMGTNARGNSGRPAHSRINGFTAYDGIICWEGFAEEDALTLSVLGSEDPCSVTVPLPALIEPPEPPAMACTELTMTPDTVTIESDATDAGTQELTITIQSDNAGWNGTLILNRSGAGELHYGNYDPTDPSTSASQFSDGHLEIPVSGVSTTVLAYYIGGEADDEVTAFITNEVEACSDVLNFNQETPPGGGSGSGSSPRYTCDDIIQGDPDDVLPDTLSGDDCNEYTFEVCFDQNRTLILESANNLFSYQRTQPSDEPLIDDIEDRLPLAGVRGECYDITVTDPDENGGVCSNGIEISYSGETCDEVGEVPVCEDFDSNTVTPIHESCAESSYMFCPETAGTYTISSDSDQICSVDEDGNETCREDALNIRANGRECYEITVSGNTCDESILFAQDGEVCYETLSEGQVGVLSSYIYTFNFLAEKDYNTEEDIFFSHDDDRAFYTLEYEPAGSEDVLVFEDTLWEDGSLEGILGDSDDSSDGRVNLAVNYADLTEYSFEYSTIRAFGFGNEHERLSNGMAEYVRGMGENIPSFIPYLKFNDGGRESEPITACEFITAEDGTVTDELASSEVCYDPNYTPEDDGRVVIRNSFSVQEASIRIRFVGVIESGISDSCDSNDEERRNGCLTEEFTDHGIVYADPSDIENPDEDTDLNSSDTAQLVVLCSYLLTQNAGDIYLDTALYGTSDLSCAYIDQEQNYSNFSNTDGLVILGPSEETSSPSEFPRPSSEFSGSDSSTSSSSSSSTDSMESLAEVYFSSNGTGISASSCSENGQNIVGNISSYVCEIVGAVGDLWRVDTVRTNTESNVSQAVRNTVTNQSRASYSSWTELTELSNRNNPNSGILYYNGAGAGSTGTVTLNGMVVPCGAHTLIVENADLRFNGNLQYAQSCSDGTSIENNLPSIAFIVLGGDIHVSSSTKHLVGVFYTNQAFTGDERSAVNGELAINGSVYGDLQPLLNAANYVGPPTLDGGSIVIRYDSRILLNTPPALSEYVNVSTEEAVNESR